MTECTYCDSTDISQHTAPLTFQYKSENITYVCEYSICNNCGDEFVDTDQIHRNDASVREAKKAHDGLLSSTEILNARNTLGLTQTQASVIFGGGKNAFSKYERNEVSQSASMDRLIRVCLAHPSVYSELCSQYGIQGLTQNNGYNQGRMSAEARLPRPDIPFFKVD